MSAHLRRAAPPIAIAATLIVTVLAVVGLIGAVDPATLRAAAVAARGDLPGLAVGLAAFGMAFAVRAWAWQRLHPDLTFGQALAAIHLALGGNHILPLRLGEPLRVVSVVRRAGIRPGDAAVTTAMLRAADMATLLALGIGSAALALPQHHPGVRAELLNSRGGWAVIMAAAVAIAGLGWMVVRRRTQRGRRTSRPGVSILGATAGAWVLEAILVSTVLGWFGVRLDLAEALFVLAAAVASQFVAITPGGIGTYEAAAIAGLVALDVPVGVAASAAVALHGVKTVWSLLVGWIALHHPAPALWGVLRLEPPATRGRSAPSTPQPSQNAPEPQLPSPAAPTSGPIILFLPAHDEAPRIADVIARTPTTVHGRPTRVVVVDDGSTDGTAAVAAAAGAEVISHSTNLGLGAAVRTGLRAGVTADAPVVVFCDADGEYDPAELRALCGPILDGHADYVVGSRFGGQIDRMLPHRRAGNLVLTRWLRWTVRQPISDGQSGYRALSPAAAAAALIPHDYNYAQVLTIDLLRKGFRYAEVPITYSFRSSGQSFVRLGRYLRNVVPTVWHQLNDLPAMTRPAPAGPSPAPHIR